MERIITISLVLQFDALKVSKISSANSLSFLMYSQFFIINKGRLFYNEA